VRTPVQKIVFKDTKGKKNGGDEAEIPQRVDRNTADRKDCTGQEKRRKTYPSEDILDPVSCLVVGASPHGME
jgi:hypothetical protein